MDRRTLGPDLGITDVPRDRVYEAMDWLAEQQDGIGAALARRHLCEGVSGDRWKYRHQRPGDALSPAATDTTRCRIVGNRIVPAQGA